MLRVIFGEDSLLWPVSSHLACENIRFSSLFVASDEERGETDVFAGYVTPS